MSAFEVVAVVVSILAIALALTSYFRINRVLSKLGRSGQTWLDHEEDEPISERPNEDDRDEPIPKRPLRGQPD